jgi:hypothetical protein
MTDDHLKQLGRVAANFQALEIRIAFWTWSLIGPDQKVGQMVTVQLPFGKLCVLARSLFDYRFPGSPFAARFAELVKRSLKCEEQRNQLFHSAWLGTDGQSEVSRLKITLKIDKGLGFNSSVVTHEEIRALADDMKQVCEEIERLIPEMGDTGLTNGSGGRG